MASRRKPPEHEVPAMKPGPSVAGLKRGNEIIHIPMAWVIPGAIPANKVTLLQGRKGTGKSMIAVALTASYTGGPKMPGYCGPAHGNVLWLCKEASFDDEIGPRLELAGASAANYYTPDGIRADGHKGTIKLPEDLEELREMVRRGRIRLIILDPLEVIKPLGFKLSEPEAARDYMEMLGSFCAEEKVTCLAIQHLTKAKGCDLTSAAYGNEELVNVARMALRCDPHPHKRRTFVLSRVAGNTGAGWKGIAYHFTGEPKGHPVLVWDGETDLDVEEVVEGTGSLVQVDEWQDAEMVLYLALRQGAVTVKDLQRIAFEAGVTWAACRRAKIRCGIEKQRIGYGAGGYWQWTSPEEWPDGLEEAAKAVSHKRAPMKKKLKGARKKTSKNTENHQRRHRCAPSGETAIGAQTNGAPMETPNAAPPN